MDARRLACLGAVVLVGLGNPERSSGQLDVLYDFEGDSGFVATDKLASDGARDGILHNRVSLQAANAPFGNQAAFFDVPTAETVPPYSSFEVAGSTQLGDSFSIALHVHDTELAGGLVRVFSSFGGTGAIGTDRMLMDYDVTGTLIPGIRVLLNNVSVGTASVPAGLGTPGYHHFAVTVDDGLVRIYFDGAEVASGNVGLGYTHGMNLRIGEDPHDVGGAANEQLIGFVDDLIVIDRRLTILEIQALATTPVPDVVSPISADYVVYHDFEGDLRDGFTAEGTDDGWSHANASLDGDPANAWDGNGSGRLGDPIPLAAPPPFSTFEVPGSTALGEDFTIALHVDNTESPPDFTHLVSSWGGTGPVGTDRLLLDYDASGALIPGIRFVLNGASVATGSVPAALAAPGYHHFAVTVDSGAVRIYLDGLEVATGNVGLGYSNAVNLRIGEDPHDVGGTADEQLIGRVDEVLLIGRTLGPAEILSLATSAVSSVVTPAPLEYAVYYDFEGGLEDRFLLDGAQDAIAHEVAFVSADATRAQRGTGSGQLRLPLIEPFSRIEMGPVGSLGSAFTLSAAVDFPRSGYAAGVRSRIFSTYEGTGSAAGSLIFDFSPPFDSVRIRLPDDTVASALGPVSTNELHTFTATYDAGDLRLYADGAEIASASTAGPVDLGGAVLYVGEDAAGPVDQNFIGSMDDVLVLSRALDAAEVLTLHEQGAASVPEPGFLLGLAAGISFLAAIGRKRMRS